MLQVEFNVVAKDGLSESRYVAEDRHGVLQLSLVGFGTYVRKSKRHAWVQVTGWSAFPHNLAELKRAGVTVVKRPTLTVNVMAELLRRVKDQVRWARDDV